MKVHDDKVLKALKAARRILIGSHYNPDGDAIGSQLALGFALERQGKEVVLFNRDPVPRNLCFLSGHERVVSSLANLANFDTVVMVDCSEPRRVGGDFETAFAKIASTVSIDHHVFEVSGAKVSIIEPAAAATGVIIARLLARMKVTLDPALATILYTTLVVDTGFFRYSNTTNSVLTLAASLVGSGADPWAVSQALEEENPPARFHLLGQSLRTLEVDRALGFASMDVTQAMFSQTGATADLSEEFTSYPRAIAGIEVAALFREGTDGKVKVSLRSKGKVDVAAMARSFGGGGHVHAAGFTLAGDMATVKARVKGAVAKKEF